MPYFCPSHPSSTARDKLYALQNTQIMKWASAGFHLPPKPHYQCSVSVSHQTASSSERERALMLTFRNAQTLELIIGTTETSFRFFTPPKNQKNGHPDTPQRGKTTDVVELKKIKPRQLMVVRQPTDMRKAFSLFWLHWLQVTFAHIDEIVPQRIAPPYNGF